MCALSACSKEREQAPAGPPPAAASAHSHDHAHDEGHGAHEPRRAGPKERVAASLITIAHADVKEYSSRRPKPSRSKAEALAVAREICAAARRDPSRFHDLARAHSEDPVAPEGGELGALEGAESSAIADVAAGLAVGGVSDPVDTEYGYRIIQRNAPVPDEVVSARQLVVAFTGATRAPAGLAPTRTKAEALARAESLATRARGEPDEFEALIKAESDGWDKARGGHMGTWTTNGGRFPAALDRAVHSLNEGGISSPIESEFGYHVLQRLAVIRSNALIAGAHILIAYQGAEKARATVTRSREEAEALASRLVEEARADPERFGALAQQHSDDVTGKRGGDLGSWRRGSMPTAFDDTMASLEPGEVGGPVLTPFGYHVLFRRRSPSEK
jgi:parvulin-like peptidyl-prolyl isomerase